MWLVLLSSKGLFFKPIPIFLKESALVTSLLYNKTTLLQEINVVHQLTRIEKIRLD